MTRCFAVVNERMMRMKNVRNEAPLSLEQSAQGASLLLLLAMLLANCCEKASAEKFV